MSLSKRQIRKTVVAQRSQMTQQQLDSAALKLALTARGYAPLMRAERIASYIPVRGEISPQQIMRSIAPTKSYLPVITDFKAGAMKFCEAETATLRQPLHKQHLISNVPLNCYGIPEPVVNQTPINPRMLDVVLVPLVAFDTAQNRLGMGAGFYDRVFEFKLWLPACKRPLLIGLAHDFQESNDIDAASWDVPLDVIITPSKIVGHDKL